MKKNNPIKIKLSTAVFFAIIVILIILFIASIFIFKNKESNINSSEENFNSSSTVNTIETNEIPDTQISDVSTDFSFNFLKMENNKKNMIYSPLSIKYALQMLNEGASGNTKAQIENVIKNTTLTKYANIKDVLSLANSIFIRDSFSKDVKENFTNTLFNKYNAEIKYDSFKDANNINNWIENKTLGQIKNMLNDKIVQDSNTKMILINALAIDMEWEDAFEAQNTYGNTFYLDNGSTLNATMMNKTTNDNDVSYYQNNDITALSMDLQEYENEQLDFLAIMPNDNLSNYINNFSLTDLENITQNLTKASDTKSGLLISIPKFSFEYDLNLKKDLINLGITDAFNNISADFSVKAAAVTTFIMNIGAVLPNRTSPIEININKPFMYLIRDKKTNEIWFVGTVYEPNSWENDKANYEN